MTRNVPAAGTELCELAAIPDGKGRAFAWGTNEDAFGVIVVRSGDTVNAFINRCPHFDIPLDHNTQVTTFRSEFVLCSHHYAAFRFVDGYCVEGPCEGGALTRIPVEIVDGRIRIGKPDASAFD